MISRIINKIPDSILTLFTIVIVIILANIFYPSKEEVDTYDDGYEEGQNDGYQDGYYEGHLEGEEKGFEFYDIGYEEGFIDGEEEASEYYDIGYDEGINDYVSYIEEMQNENDEARKLSFKEWKELKLEHSLKNLKGANK